MSVNRTRRFRLRRNARRRDPWVPSSEAARREIRRTQLRRYHRHRSNVLLFILFFAILFGGTVYYFCFDLVAAQGVGMSPAIESGSRVLCLKQSILNKLIGIVPESFRRVERGDVVLVRYRLYPDSEDSPTALLLRRVIATGGDEIDEGGGELILNREELVGWTGAGDLVYPIRVPAGKLFLLGDQSSLSVDSRMRSFGMIDETDVTGRALLVVWPLFSAGPVS